MGWLSQRKSGVSFCWFFSLSLSSSDWLFVGCLCCGRCLTWANIRMTSKDGTSIIQILQYFPVLSRAYFWVVSYMRHHHTNTAHKTGDIRNCSFCLWVSVSIEMVRSTFSFIVRLLYPPYNVVIHLLLSDCGNVCRFCAYYDIQTKHSFVSDCVCVSPRKKQDMRQTTTKTKKKQSTDDGKKSIRHTLMRGIHCHLPYTDTLTEANLCKL